MLTYLAIILAAHGDRYGPMKDMRMYNNVLKASVVAAVAAAAWPKLNKMYVHILGKMFTFTLF